MPCESFRMTTSSPVEGLLEVLLVTLPVRSAARAVAASVRIEIMQRRAGAPREVFRKRLLIIQFKSVGDWKQSIAPAASQSAHLAKLPSRTGSLRLRLQASCAATHNLARDTSLPCSRSSGREGFRTPPVFAPLNKPGAACQLHARRPLREQRHREAVQRQTKCRRRQSQLSLPPGLFPIWVERCRIDRRRRKWLSLFPLADHDCRSKSSGEKHGKRHDPGHTIKSASAGSGEDGRSVFTHERLQNGIVVRLVLNR